MYAAFLLALWDTLLGTDVELGDSMAVVGEVNVTSRDVGIEEGEDMFALVRVVSIDVDSCGEFRQSSSCSVLTSSMGSVDFSRRRRARYCLQSNRFQYCTLF